MKRIWLTGPLALIVALGACGDATQKEPPATPADGGMGGHGGMGAADTSAFGQPGDVEMADRALAVSMFDTFRFEPTELSVDRGETITFEVTNDGALPHEFVLGDRSFQEEHEAVMTEMAGDLPPDELFAVGVQPGETKTLAWTFTKEGTFMYACHVSGHYVAGMVGTITVEE